jgi:hypothetical protein
MRTICLFVAIALSIAFHAFAAEPSTAPALSRLPVKEITVFKDGHCLMLHSGAMPIDADGNVVLDNVPTPVLGTFWPFSNDQNAKLVSTVSGQRLVKIDRTALTLKELIQANLGAEVIVREMGAAPGEKDAISYTAKILSIPTQSIAEIERTSPIGSTPTADQQSNIVLLKVDSGTKLVSMDRILELTFRGDVQPAWSHDEYRNVITLKLAVNQDRTKRNIDVGMMYVQKGIRWIPNYKITIDGNGQAKVQLQATVINEMTDLSDVTANLVIGVPNFELKDTIDPIAVQQAVAQLSQYFQQNVQTGLAMSNAIMTQAGARAGEFQRRQMPEEGRGAQRPMDLGPKIQGSGKSEDLFVFTVNHITLKKGQRMVVPVTEFTLPYSDVYALDIPFAPPPDVRRSWNTPQQADLVRLFNAPKVMHKIRLQNDSKYPITTAPALIVRDGKALGQGMTSYSPIGAACDVNLTTAVDIKVKKSDEETKRTPDAAHWDGNAYFKIDLTGHIILTNYTAKPVQIEVTRNLLGNADAVEQDGKIEAINLFEDDDYVAPGEYPQWWGWYSWPYWWYHFNGVSRVTWSVKLEPKQKTELKYTWYYYWR